MLCSFHLYFYNPHFLHFTDMAGCNVNDLGHSKGACDICGSLVRLVNTGTLHPSCLQHSMCDMAVVDTGGHANIHFPQVSAQEV